MRIARQRSRTQRLTGPPFDHSEQVVGWLGAVQAQEYALAKWSLGQRSRAAHDAIVEQAIAEGTILRTHVLRPTWHFVLPEDIRWMLDLTGPRVQASIGSYLHKLGLDEDVLMKAHQDRAGPARRQPAHAKGAEGCARGAGIEVDGLRLGFIMSHVELIGLVCSGARRGKQHTYALLSERAPDARVLDPDVALLELTLRYFTSHGPATVKDFNWWSSLRMADIRTGIEMAGSRQDRRHTHWNDQTQRVGPDLERAARHRRVACERQRYDRDRPSGGPEPGSRCPGRGCRVQSLRVARPTIRPGLSLRSEWPGRLAFVAP